MTTVTPETPKEVDAQKETVELLRKINNKLAFFAFVLVLYIVGQVLAFLTTY